MYNFPVPSCYSILIVNMSVYLSGKAGFMWAFCSQVAPDIPAWVCRCSSSILAFRLESQRSGLPPRRSGPVAVDRSRRCGVWPGCPLVSRRLQDHRRHHVGRSRRQDALREPAPGAGAEGEGGAAESAAGGGGKVRTEEGATGRGGRANLRLRLSRWELKLTSASWPRPASERLTNETSVLCDASYPGGRSPIKANLRGEGRTSFKTRAAKAVRWVFKRYIISKIFRQWLRGWEQSSGRVEVSLSKTPNP